MHAVLLCCSFVLCVTRIYSATTSQPAMQRKIAGESCRFRWSVRGNFTAYTIKLLSTGSPSALGSNANHTFNSSNGLITLFIWNIQLSDAGYYSLSINTGPSTDVTSVVLLFVYAYPNAYPNLNVGRQPGFQGDRIELDCSATSYSLPASDRPKMYYFWYSGWYGAYFRNISSGPAVLRNGDVVSGYTFKNDGKSLVIASAQYSDNSFSCSVQEEGSPYTYNNYNSLSLTIYGKPYTYSFNPTSRKANAALYSFVYLYFSYQANPPITSYTNWSFVNAFGNTTEYSVGSNPYNYRALSFYLYSVNSYGNYSVSLTNSNGTKTETFQVVPTGPPDAPSDFSVQYLTHSRISLQWRCMWFNGAQQTVFVRITDVATNTELETQNIRLDTNCYNLRYGTLFQRSVQPETNYDASIWSINLNGSSNVVKLVLRTPKRLIFSVSPSNISIVETEATIKFLIFDSTTTLIRLNVTCCVEVTPECNNKSYILTNTDNQILYDILPTGTEYVFDFNVFDTDGYTYEYNMAIVKGVRVSTLPITVVTTPTTYIPYDVTTLPWAFNGTTPFDNGNPLFIPVIVLAVLLGVTVLVLFGCCIGLLHCRCHQKNSLQLPATARTSVPTRNNPAIRESSEFSAAYDNYEPVVDVDRPNNNVYYKALGGTPGNAKQFSETSHADQSPESGREDKQNPYMNPDEIFYTKPSGTLDRPKRNRYQ